MDDMCGGDRNTADNAAMDEQLCEIEASVVTGFEIMAKEEIWEKFGIEATTDRGKANMFIKIKDVKKVTRLTCHHGRRIVECCNSARHQFLRTLAIFRLRKKNY